MEETGATAARYWAASSTTFAMAVAFDANWDLVAEHCPYPAGTDSAR